MKKILIIDDEPGILAMYSDCLSDAGYQLLTAPTGDKGIEIALEEDPDLILLDIIMPRVNGLDALGQLKENAKTRHIPVYLLSNLPENATGDKPKSLGAAGYLVKAEIEPQKLLEIVNDIFKK